MTELPWLMIVLALTTAVQWPNSIANQTNSYDSYSGEHLRSPRGHRSKRWNTDRKMDATLNTTSKSITTAESQTIQSARIYVKNTNKRTLSALNQTKSLNYEYSNSYYNQIQPRNEIKQKSKYSSTVIFPTSNEETKTTLRFPVRTFMPEPRAIEKCKTNTSVCIKIDNYPTRQEIFKILKDSKFKSNELFVVETNVEDVQSRSFNDLQPLCNSKEDVIFPEAGITKNNEWRFIVQDANNTNSSFNQGIIVETCVDNQECEFNNNLPKGYTSTCVQNYMYKKLVAVKNSQEVYYESFKFPSCCSCMFSVVPTKD